MLQAGIEKSVPKQNNTSMKASFLRYQAQIG
jgi:hypothetical protein